MSPVCAEEENSSRVYLTQTWYQVPGGHDRAKAALNNSTCKRSRHGFIRRAFAKTRKKTRLNILNNAQRCGLAAARVI